MTDSPYFIPFVVLIAAVLLARFVAERGLNQLSREHKGLVVEAFSTLRQANILVLFVLIFAAMKSPLLGMLLVVVYFLGVGVYSFRRLRRLEIPDSYTKAYATSLALQVAGFSVYIVYLFRPAQ